MTFDIIYYETLSSTNNEAIRLATQGAEEGTVVICNRQTEGRGQRNNKWVAAEGENLTVSLILKPELNAGELFLISKTFSLAIVNVLHEYGVNALIKWPNDIYVNNNKIAGILIEHSFLGNRLNFTVIGLGLNINQIQFPPMEVAPTSLILETNNKYDINSVLKDILNQFSILNDTLYTSKEVINEGYMQKLYRRYGYFKYKTKGGLIFSAKINDVADSGELILEDEQGVLSEFLFKEVEYL